MLWPFKSRVHVPGDLVNVSVQLAREMRSMKDGEVLEITDGNGEMFAIMRSEDMRKLTIAAGVKFKAQKGENGDDCVA